MKNAYIPLFLFLLVFLSGCVQFGEEKRGISQSGIVVTDFSSSREEIEGMNRLLRIYMEVENNGGYSTDKVLMCLLGSFGNPSEGMWKLENEQCKAAKRKLDAADPANAIPGGTARAAWTLKSPWVPYPQERKDIFTGRVYYFYKTKTTAKVIVYSETEVEARKQRGESVSSVGMQTSTQAPLAISLSTPELIRAEDGYFTLRITLSNVGNGVVFDSSNFDWDSKTPPKISIDNLNIVKLKISYPESDLTLEACENKVELKKGEKRTISCDFTIKNPEAITTMKEYPITVESEYGYYIDKGISITVRGRKGESP